VRERAAREETERLVERDALLADLNRPPNATERLLIDELAALAVRARRLRAQGKPADDVARLMTRIAGKLGLRLGAAAKPPGESLEQYAARTRVVAQPAADPCTTDLLAQPAAPSGGPPSLARVMTGSK